MNLIERYLTDVGRRVPARQRADVQAELRAAIEDALDARGATSTSEDDGIVVLKALGSPERVAAGYYPAGQSLIGPEFYPAFKKVVSIVLLFQLALALGGFFVSIGMHGIDASGSELLAWIGWAFRSMTTAVAVIVLVFAGVQRAGATMPQGASDWDPRKLPAFGERDLVSRAESAFGLVVAGVFMVIVSDVAASFRADLPAQLQPLLARVIDLNLLMANVALLMFVVVYALLLVQGGWRPYTRALSLIADVIVLAVFVRVAITLIGARAEMQAVGLPSMMINLLVFGAAATAVGVLAAIIAQQASFRRRAASRAGMVLSLS